MNARSFMYDLEEVLALSKLSPESKTFRRRADRLIKDRCDLESLDFPEKKRLERIYWTSGLLYCAYFLLYITGLFLYGKTLSEPVSDAGFWLIMAGFAVAYLLLLPAIRSSILLSRARRAYTRGFIRDLGQKLQQLTPGQLEAVDLFIHDSPPCTWGEPVRPGDMYVCYGCGCTFPIGKNDWDELTEVNCPHCGSDQYIFWSSAEVPATNELLQILHDLFIEE